jgi:hypothetical protein
MGQLGFEQLRQQIGRPAPVSSIRTEIRKLPARMAAASSACMTGCSQPRMASAAITQTMVEKSADTTALPIKAPTKRITTQATSKLVARYNRSDVVPAAVRAAAATQSMMSALSAAISGIWCSSVRTTQRGNEEPPIKLRSLGETRFPIWRAATATAKMIASSTSACQLNRLVSMRVQSVSSTCPALLAKSCTLSERTTASSPSSMALLKHSAGGKSSNLPQ